MTDDADRHATTSRLAQIKAVTMKIWFDCEFFEDGRTIDLISLGAVREDGRTFYAEDSSYDRARSSQWLRDHVIPHLTPEVSAIPRGDLAGMFRDFAGDAPSFRAWYADYDWVCLCQLYGTMLDLPQGWPKYAYDIRQLQDSLGIEKVPKTRGRPHHALDDAHHAHEIERFLVKRPA